MEKAPFVAVFAGMGAVACVAVGRFAPRRRSRWRHGVVDIVSGVLLVLAVSPWFPAFWQIWTFAAGFAGAALTQLLRGWLTSRTLRSFNAMEARLGSAAAASRQNATLAPGPRTIVVRVLYHAGIIEISRDAVVQYGRMRNRLNRRCLGDHLALFRFWLRERGSRYLWVSLLGIVMLAGATAYDVRAEPGAWRFSPLVQGLFILGLVLMSGDPIVDERHEAGSKAVKQLYYNWLALWFTWFALYVLLFGNYNCPTVGNLPTLWAVARDTLDIVTSFFIFVCYLVIGKITVFLKDDVQPTAPYVSLRRVYVFGSIAIVLFIGLETYLHVAVSTPGEAVHRYVRFSTGIIAGTALCLLVGRLESKFIDPPLWLVIPLYAYGVLQGALAAFGGMKDFHAFLCVAFLLKCMLFVFVSWLLESGILLYYFIELRRAGQTGSKERFLEDAGNDPDDT